MSDPNFYGPDGRRIRIQIWFPELPPTTNRIHAGNRLTDEAREYRTRFGQFIQQNYGHQISEMGEPNEKEQSEDGEIRDVCTKDPNLIFGIDFTFFMDCLTTWGTIDLSASRRARFRFAKNDLTNRVKFVEDCFRKAVDIDDSITFQSSQRKIHSPDHTGVFIDYYVVPVESFGVKRIT